MPTHFVEDRASYQRSLDAAILARDKSIDSGRKYVDYWIGRLRFGIGYFDTLESVRLAAIAEKNDDIAAAQQHAADALNSATVAIESYAEVVWNQSDRGAIATLAEYVYRPLQAKLVELQNEDG